MADEIWEFYAKEYQARESRWEPVRSGVPYTCNECPALIEIRELAETWERIANGFYHFFPSAASLEQLGWDDDLKQEFAEHMEHYRKLGSRG